MRVGLLGPLLIEVDDATVDLVASTTRRAFIYLALHVGQVVTADRLAQAVWPHAPPPHLERAVHSLVYRLRQQLANVADRVPVVRREPGYVLQIDQCDVDAHVFERRLDEAHEIAADDPAGARIRFEAALQLWRGEPLMDVAYEPWALPEAQRICERYVAALEAIARCDVELGHLERAVADLKALTATYPLRESLWALLWQALAQWGRFSEVVDSHRRCTSLLSDEFGIVTIDHLDDLARELVRAMDG